MYTKGNCNIGCAKSNFSRRGLSLLWARNEERTDNLDALDMILSNEQKIVGGCGAQETARVNGSQASRGHFLLHFIALRLKWRREKGVEISSEIIKTLASDRCNDVTALCASVCEYDFRPKARAIVPVTIVWS